MLEIVEYFQHYNTAEKTIILCSVYSKWFVKYELSSEIWFMKLPLESWKIESQVIKSKPEVFEAWLNIY